MGLSAQSHLFPKINGFSTENQLFLVKTKKTIFLESGRIVYQNVCFRFFCFPQQQVGFCGPKRSFPQEILFGPKPFLSYEKFGFALKTSFEKPKNIFVESGRIVSQKMIILFFCVARKKLGFRPKTICFRQEGWFSCPRPSFLLGKVEISFKDQLFPSKECVFHLLSACVANQCCQ